MWGNFLLYVSLVGFVAGGVFLIRASVAMGRAGYSLWPSREPLADLPRSDRREIARAIMRGQPVPPGLHARAEHWSRFMLVVAGYRWACFWLVLALFALTLDDSGRYDPVLGGFYWALWFCKVSLIGIGAGLWRSGAAARRFLKTAAA